MRPILAALLLVALCYAADADPVVRDLLVGVVAFVGGLVALVAVGECLVRRP